MKNQFHFTFFLFYSKSLQPTTFISLPKFTLSFLYLSSPSRPIISLLLFCIVFVAHYRHSCLPSLGPYHAFLSVRGVECGFNQNACMRAVTLSGAYEEYFLSNNFPPILRISKINATSFSTTIF